MTDTTPTSTLFMGIYIPVADFKPTPIPEPMYSIAKAKVDDDKALAKYLATVAAALDVMVDGMTRDGKAIKPADLVGATLAWQMEAEAEAARRKEAAEAARKEAEARAARLADLDKAIKAALGDPKEAGKVTYTTLKGWADQAAKEGAYIAFHGGDGDGAGLFLRFKGASTPGASTGGAGRPTGGGKKGGTETRTSAYAEAVRGMKKGDPFAIRRVKEADGSWAYFDDARGGLRLTMPLSRYLLAEYPDSLAARSIKGYEERRKAAKAGATAGDAADGE